MQTASVAITVYHFEKEKLKFATGAMMLGYCTGVAIFPVPTTYIFEAYGFHVGMLIFTVPMLLHLFGVVTYTQENAIVTSKGLPGKKPLKDSLIEIAYNGKVSVCYHQLWQDMITTNIPQ